MPGFFVWGFDPKVQRQVCIGDIYICMASLFGLVIPKCSNRIAMTHALPCMEHARMMSNLNTAVFMVNGMTHGIPTHATQMHGRHSYVKTVGSLMCQMVWLSS